MTDQFMHEDQVNANISYWQMFRKLWPYGKRSRGLLAATLISVLVLAVTSRLLPTLIGYAIDNGILKNDRRVILTSAFSFLVFEILKSFSQWSYLFFFQKFGNRVLYFVREDLIRHIQSLPMDYFNRTPAGRIVTRVTNDVSNLGDLFTEGVITVFTEFVSLVAILVAMTLISWKLTLMTMLLSPAFIWASFRFSDRVRDILRESKKKLSVINSFVAENLNGIKVVQLYNRIPRNRRRFAMLSDEYAILNLSSIRAYAMLQPVMNLFSAVTITTALYFGGVMSLDGSLAMGSLVAFLMHVQDFIPPLREILEKYQQFQNSLTSAERVFHMFDEVPEVESPDQILLPKGTRGHIEIKNLSFRYKPELPEVLKNISVSIRPGESVAIVGRTGSGKSTLISLFQKFYKAPTETIFIDQTPLERIRSSSLRQKMGVVLQDNFIFRGTVRDNISLCEESISEDSIERACRQVGYETLLKRSGRTLNSHVEERGANLSVGERQLLGFARILAFEPDILILDEATANVDSQTEDLIHRATQKIIRGRTSLIIAHRLSTIRDCDRIIVLDHGEILETGSHEELLKLGGFYYALVNSHSQTVDDHVPSIGS